MAKRIDLRSRVDEATLTVPTAWDPDIAKAILKRREQQLAERSSDNRGSGTELIQARLAEARAREAAEETETTAAD